LVLGGWLRSPTVGEALTSLALRDNRLRLPALEALEAAAPTLYALREIDLRHTSIGGRASCALVARFVQQAPALTAADLADNSLEPGGKRALAGMLGAGCRLQTLVLELGRPSQKAQLGQPIAAVATTADECDEAEAAADSDAESRRGTATLLKAGAVELRLVRRRLAADDLPLLAGWLVVSPVAAGLKQLDLGYNRLVRQLGTTDEAAADLGCLALLATALQSVTGLQGLGLAGIGLGPEGAEMLAQTFVPGPALQMVDLSDNPLIETDWR
jgi:hypothetical protein